MANSYFVEYNEYINGLQQELMQIQFRYNECIENVKRARESGVLSNEDFEILINQRMDTYYEKFDSEFRLAKSDVDFVKTYADLDKNGILLATFLKREYFDKKDVLVGIFDSVKVYSYLDSMNSKDAKLTVKNEMFKHYNSQLHSVDEKMKRLVDIGGENERKSKRYLELEHQKRLLIKALGVIGNLENMPQEMYEKLVEQFYSVDKKYYEWFLKMQIKHEYEDGSVYQEHVDTLNGIQETSDTLVDVSEELAKENNVLDDTKKEVFNALIGVSLIDIDRYIELQRKPKRHLFRKEELNNKELLFEIFEELFAVESLKPFIKSLYVNDVIEMDLRSIFETYFSTKYGEDTLYVDFNKFLNDFRNEILYFYKEKVSRIIDKIKDLNDKISSNSTLMCDNIRVSMNQALLQKEIRDQYPARKEDLLIAGFTMVELNRIYADLKELLGNGFSFGTDGEVLSLRKV